MAAVDDSFANLEAAAAMQESEYMATVDDSFANLEAAAAMQESEYMATVDDSFARLEAAPPRQEEDHRAVVAALRTAAPNGLIHQLEAGNAAREALRTAVSSGIGHQNEAQHAATETLDTAVSSGLGHQEGAQRAAMEASATESATLFARQEEAHVAAMEALDAATDTGLARLKEAHVAAMEALSAATDTSLTRLEEAHVAAIETLDAAVSQWGIEFAGVVTRTNLPSQVQVVFSLRDRDGHAIVLPAEDVQKATRIFERGPGTEDWEEIDYTETSFFVHTAENFDLEVVFVLDFTNSMAQARLPDGRSGIAGMLEAFNAGLSALPGAHRIGVVEFHDRNVEPGVLSVLTTNRQAIRDRTSQFSQGGFDPGSSRVWDSVVSGVNLFSNREQNPRAVRALVFLSDGKDTSSVNERDDARRHAQVRGVQLYVMGVGEVFQEEELGEMASLTGGRYYQARDVSLLQEQLQLLVSDLRGQYQVTYITLRRAGEYSVRVAVEVDGARGSIQTAPFDAATFFGPDNQGVIQFDPPSLDRGDGQVTAFVRALHVPRNVDRIRFRADTSKPVSVELVTRRDGGLLDRWTLSGPDADGFYEASSPDPLEFGNLGLLFKLIISDVTERFLYIPFELDNTIYTAGKSLGRTAPLSIDPRQIAFTSSRDGNDEIYVMNADGSGVTRLTDHPGRDTSPDWSPDGRQIAFTSERDGNDEIYVMNADGSGVTRLTDHPARDTSPDWSPDGGQIAFTSERDGNLRIYVMNADGSGVTRLTDNHGWDTSPDWTPDGGRIAFASYRDRNWEIYVVNADGSGVTRLTDHPELDWDPAWSPDGGQIAFAYERDGNPEIYVMNAVGSGATRLTDHPARDTSPDWSPDGGQIAFTSERDGNPEVYVMNADGSGATRLTDHLEHDREPAWSPQ